MLVERVDQYHILFPNCRMTAFGVHIYCTSIITDLPTSYEKYVIFVLHILITFFSAIVHCMHLLFQRLFAFICFGMLLFILKDFAFQITYLANSLFMKL